MNRTRRPGYTILELLVVLALLVILGAVLLPSITGFEGNAKQRAAADIVRTRLAEARAKAMELGVPFRVAVSSDGTRLRVSADGGLVPESTGGDSGSTEDAFEVATVSIELEEGDERVADEAGWVTVATMRPDGSSKEPRPTVVSVQQGKFPPILIQVRGLTGQARTMTGQKATGGQP